MSQQIKQFDLLRVPIVGEFLRWRHARTALQFPVLIVGVVMIAHGLFGPSLAPKNLAANGTWVFFRGALVLVLLAAGNLFCLACPFVLVRDWARRVFHPRFSWPRRLRNKWLSVALFIAILFCYEQFALWSSPWWTACLILAYFGAVLIVDGLFKHASFCKFVCPIGQFNFVASTISPLEVTVREQSVCAACDTRDCIRGRREPAGLVTIQRGCELALFQPQKVGNIDCTFCLDCVQACPHDNVGILRRPAAVELMTDRRRSGVGSLTRRKDIAALVLVFTFGALLNAFGMVSPVYALEAWLARALHLNHAAPVLGLIFAFALVVEPLALLGAAAWITRAWAGSRKAALRLIVRYAYGLVPLGFGMWLAHYSFHFLTGFLTIIPVTQSALVSVGLPLLGPPRWTWTGLPVRFVHPIEFTFLALGFACSLWVIHRLAQEETPQHTIRGFLPWAAVCTFLWVAAVWLINQPMDMRGTLMG